MLERTSGRSVDGALACALATLLLLIPANLMTLMTIHAPAGLVATTRLYSGIERMWTGWPLFGDRVRAGGGVVPLAGFGLLAAVLSQ